MCTLHKCFCALPSKEAMFWNSGDPTNTCISLHDVIVHLPVHTSGRTGALPSPYPGIPAA